MVAASHWLAAQSGMLMLESGGNAFDAAAAAGFVLEVVEPHQNGLGGEAPMVLYSAAERDVFVVNGQGPAPRAATAAAFADLGLELVPGDGLLAACVPAAFGSFLLLLERFGTLPLREVLSPAIGYARRGFPVLPSLSQVLVEMEPAFGTNWPSSAELWTAAGRPEAGRLMRNERLATTYERLLGEAEAAGSERGKQIEAARRAFYEGFVAESIFGFIEKEKAGGTAALLGPEDLASWQATLEAPARLHYRQFEIFKTGPWGQGPVLLQQLALLSGFDVGELGLGSPELVHVVIECAKLAFADREAFYGDPLLVDVPLGELLSPSYNEERRRLVGGEASFELRPGRPEGREGRLPRAGRSDPPAEGGLAGHRLKSASPPAAHDTCHVDVVDRFGNLISATPSGGWLQGSPAVPGLGFCLGTRAQMFWLEEGLASSLSPGARPRTTLSPSLAFRDGEPYMAFGTPGGDQQDQWPLRVLLYHADFGLPLQAAVDTPSWHSEHFPSSFFPRERRPALLKAESTLGEQTLSALRRKGHDVEESEPFSLGLVTAVARQGDGRLWAASDCRAAQAYAVGR
jgi:gamma-glutamyltranspeptidase/glutathione hydrolase